MNQNKNKTHCKRGHRFSKENTYITPNGERTCKTCQNMHQKKWRDKNKAYFKKYQKENKEKYLAATRRWVARNLEKSRARAREWRRNNLKRARANDKAWARKNKDKANAKTHKRNTRLTGAGGSFTAAEWTALCEKYNNRCLCCGKRRKLTADHVIPVSKGGTSNISNIQPLCGPCNSRKGAKTIDFRKKRRQNNVQRGKRRTARRTRA